jgi:hypothetical protein
MLPVPLARSMSKERNKIVYASRVDRARHSSGPGLLASSLHGHVMRRVMAWRGVGVSATRSTGHHVEGDPPRSTFREKRAQIPSILTACLSVPCACVCRRPGTGMLRRLAWPRAFQADVLVTITADLEQTTGWCFFAAVAPCKTDPVE